MELRVLRYFLAVAQEKNITKAAEKLLVSQPTLSNQLAALEQELGVTLFTRGHRQITLTSEGEYLRARANEMVQLADQTAANIQSQQVISGELSIGAGESIGMQRIMNIVAGIIQDYPDVKINLVSGDAFDTESKLTHGTLDFAVFMGDHSLSSYNYLQLPETDQWGLITRKDDPLAKKVEITPSDLIDLPLVLSHQAIKTDAFQDWWGNLGRKMNIIGTTNLAFNASLLVLNKGAYMITFKGLSESRKNDLKFIPLTPELSEPITIVWKKNTVLSKVAQLFLNRIKASFEEDL